jgi:MFS family permease
MTPTEWGIVGSAYTLGGLIGALSAGPLAGKYGRRRTMQVTTIFFIIGPVFEALSPNIGVMAFGRLVSGVGAGAAVVVVPIYISEIAPPAEKGFFGAFTQIGCNVGILVTQLLGYFLSHGQYWRVVLAAGGMIGVLQSLGLLLTAESPKYLADQGHAAQAKRILRKIRGDASNIDEEISSWETDGADDVDEEQTLLRDEDREPLAPKDQQGKEEALSIVQVLRHPDYKKAAFAVIMVMLAQQLSGMHALLFLRFVTNKVKASTASSCMVSPY